MEHHKHQIAASTDPEIIEKVLAGESLLFEVLVRRYNPVLYRIARSYGFNHQDAEDLMQEAHVTAFLHLPQLEQPLYYKTWLSTILSNKCLYKKNHGYYGKEEPYGKLKEDSSGLVHGAATDIDAEHNILNRELATVLETTVQSLPLAYRAVLVLREIEGFSIKETAALMHITPANVKVRLVRAKALIQKKLRNVYASQIFEFNLIYCDAIVRKVLDQVRCLKPLSNSEHPTALSFKVTDS